MIPAALDLTTPTGQAESFIRLVNSRELLADEGLRKAVSKSGTPILRNLISGGHLAEEKRVRAGLMALRAEADKRGIAL